jgi:hypothetical protein
MPGQKPTEKTPSPPHLIAKPVEPGVQMTGCCLETGFKCATAVTRSPSEIPEHRSLLEKRDI